MTEIQTLPAVVLPGLDGTGDLLQSFVQRLAVDRDVRLIAYPQEPSLGYKEIALYVQSKLPAKPFVLIAESYSGPVAIEIATRSALIAGLVLSSTFVTPPLPKRLGALAEFVAPSSLPDVLISAVLLGRGATEDLQRRLIRVVRSLPVEVIRRRVRDVMEVDRRGDLIQIKCPVLLLHGRRDRQVRGRHAVEIARALRCEVTWFDAPHMLLETNADAAVRTINHFCATQGFPLSHSPYA